MPQLELNEPEYNKFMESKQDKSDATKKQYRIQYNKLYKLTNKPIAETSEKKLMEIIDGISGNNNKQALLNIAILVRRMEKYSTTKLEDLQQRLKGEINKDIKIKNVELKETLPKYQELVDYTDYLWDKNEWTDYIINYLLLNYQVRNQDLDFDIVKRKKDANDPEKNYMWLQPKKVSYIRNRYKTAQRDGKELGGKKINVIDDPKFIVAMRRVLGCQKYDLECGTFIPNKNAIAYHLQKATYKGIGEGKTFKVIVNHFRDDIDKLKEIANNRGTDIKTVLDFYDIDRKD